VIHRLREYLNAYVQFKWVLGVYVLIIVVSFMAISAQRSQQAERLADRQVQIQYLDYQSDLRDFDRCATETERSNALNAVLTLLGEDEPAAFRARIDIQFPLATVAEACGTPPVEPSSPEPPLIDNNDQEVTE